MQGLAERESEVRTDIGHQPIGVRIRNALLERIIGGHYEPGQRLIELQLAREFGSSQAPQRLSTQKPSGLVGGLPVATIRDRWPSTALRFQPLTNTYCVSVKSEISSQALRS